MKSNRFPFSPAQMFHVKHGQKLCRIKKTSPKKWETGMEKGLSGGGIGFRRQGGIVLADAEAGVVGGVKMVEK